MTKTLRINPTGKTNYETEPVNIRIKYEEVQGGNDILVKGIPDGDVVVGIALFPSQDHFVLHKPENDKAFQKLRLHYEAGHSFKELSVLSAVACDGELTVHYQGNGHVGQLYFPPAGSKRSPTSTINGTKANLERLV